MPRNCEDYDPKDLKGRCIYSLCVRRPCFQIIITFVQSTNSTHVFPTVEPQQGLFFHAIFGILVDQQFADWEGPGGSRAKQLEGSSQLAGRIRRLAWKGKMVEREHYAAFLVRLTEKFAKNCLNRALICWALDSLYQSWKDLSWWKQIKFG